MHEPIRAGKASTCVRGGLRWEFGRRGSRQGYSWQLLRGARTRRSCMGVHRPDRRWRRARRAAGHCPTPAASKLHVMIDYVDFVHHDATEYIADLHRVAPINAVHLSQRVLTVQSSFAQINHVTSANPGPAHEGDAAFLLPGTPVYGIKGWSPSCRLAARHDGHWHIYLAYQPNARVATPKACALSTHSAVMSGNAVSGAINSDRVAFGSARL